MRTRSILRAVDVGGSAAALTAATTATASAASQQVRQGTDHGGRIKHVLLISVDGLHKQDLAWYIRTHRDSVLARLVRHGVEYRNAQTPFPSDSFPGHGGPGDRRRPWDHRDLL